jgi:hypothetical protein
MEWDWIKVSMPRKKPGAVTRYCGEDGARVAAK